MPADAILLIEDNPDDVTLTVHAFRRNNINAEILVAHDGLEALDRLLPADQRAPLRPAIILLDLHLPKMHGLEVLARIRAEPSTRFLPVIILTVERDDCDLHDNPDDTAKRYLQKPVRAGEFLKAARSMGVQWPTSPTPP